MILGFKERSKQPILDGTKIHSIREDKHDRWKAGRKIHGATGVRTKNYNCFFEDVCKSIQKIEIQHTVILGTRLSRITIDGVLQSTEQIEKLAINDGFKNRDDFFKWFDKDYTGKIIHWTDFRY